MIYSSPGFISLLMLLDLSSAFDTIDHLVLIDRLENLVGLSGQVLSRLSPCLSEHHQFGCTAIESSYRSRVRYGIPQGSVLGHLLFSLYMLLLGKIIRNHGITSTATQITLSCTYQPNLTPLQNYQTWKPASKT